MDTNFLQQRRVMNRAHLLYNERPFRQIRTKSAARKTASAEWKEILEYAWYFEWLKRAMQTGIVRFSYFKDNGDIREARGTLCFDLIPTENIPTTPRVLVEENYEVFRYYDIDSKGWRSFRITGFIGYVEIRSFSEAKGAKEKVTQKEKKIV